MSGDLFERLGEVARACGHEASEDPGDSFSYESPGLFGDIGGERVREAVRCVRCGSWFTVSHSQSTLFQGGE